MIKFVDREGKVIAILEDEDDSPKILDNKNRPEDISFLSGEEEEDFKSEEEEE